MVKIKYSKEKKQKLRQELREKIKNFKDFGESEKLCNMLKFYPKYQVSDNVLLYASLKGEVDLFSLLKDKTKKFYFPKIFQDQIKIYQISSKEDLIVGGFGILEPKNCAYEVSLETIDTVIAPGLAFTLKGDRLGRGMGFYDRFLKKLRTKNPEVFVCALAYDFQIMSTVYADKNDEKVDKIFTV
jgi:5-formyltetrahydrofolate cyclo-ligase